jgi:hypothetical protein
MMRTEAEFRRLLADEPCWDLSTEELFDRHGEGLQDRMLQNREEVIALCLFIERARVRSYLEVGIWTGRLVSALHRLFSFDLVAACDHGYAERFGLEVRVPSEARFFGGDSGSTEFRQWREQLGRVDLVLLDGDHRLPGLRRDFEVNRSYPHRFVAIHDICGARRATRDVRRFWRELGDGHAAEIIRPHVELGLDHSMMGIGIWSATEDPGLFTQHGCPLEPGQGASGLVLD